MKDRDASAGTCTTRTLMKEGNPSGIAMSLPGMGDAVGHGHAGVLHGQGGAVLDAVDQEVLDAGEFPAIDQGVLNE